MMRTRGGPTSTNSKSASGDNGDRSRFKPALLLLTPLLQARDARISIRLQGSRHYLLCESHENEGCRTIARSRSTTTCRHENEVDRTICRSTTTARVASHHQDNGSSNSARSEEGVTPCQDNSRNASKQLALPALPLQAKSYQ